MKKEAFHLKSESLQHLCAFTVKVGVKTRAGTEVYYKCEYPGCPRIRLPHWTY